MTLTELAQRRNPAAPLTASVAADGASTVVTLRGEADLATLPVVIDVLTRVIADNDGPVIVDLAQTDFIDTGTVRVLGRAWEFLGHRGRALTVRSPSRVAARVLGFFGISDVIEPGQ
jgi:anti-anti-sigma factor